MNVTIFAGVAYDPGERMNLVHRLYERCTPRPCRKGGNCMLWNGAITGRYPAVRLGGRVTNARRLIFTLATGRNPGRHVLRSSCRNPLCLNPNHLYLANQFKSPGRPS